VRARKDANSQGTPVQTCDISSHRRPRLYKAEETVVCTHSHTDLHTEAGTLLVSIAKADKCKYEVSVHKFMI